MQSARITTETFRGWASTRNRRERKALRGKGKTADVPWCGRGEKFTEDTIRPGGALEVDSGVNFRNWEKQERCPAFEGKTKTERGRNRKAVGGEKGRRRSSIDN